jgi:GT2 family glycosyltransferase
VAPLVLRWPGTPEVVDSAGDGYDRGGFAWNRGRGEPLCDDYQTPQSVFGASGCGAFYRRELVLRLGGFPEEFGAYFEDVDLSFRLHWAGFAVAYAPDCRLLHRGGATHGRPAGRLLEQQSCNEERVFWRNLPGPILLRSLPRHAAVLLGKAVRRWREGTFAPWLAGRLRAWGEVGPILRHRRRLARLGPPPRIDSLV